MRHQAEKAMGLELSRQCLEPRVEQSLLELRPPAAKHGFALHESLIGRAPRVTTA
jgi:hypothetical protein